jgi:hypothetical protein
LIVVDAVVDETGAPARRHTAEALARELGVNLAAVVRDKPKTRAKESKYGLCNAYRASQPAPCGRPQTTQQTPYGMAWDG